MSFASEEDDEVLFDSKQLLSRIFSLCLIKFTDQVDSAGVTVYPTLRLLIAITIMQVY